MLAFGLIVCLQFAEPAASEVLKKRAFALARQFGDPSFRKREAAAAELLKLGWDAKAALDAGLDSSDAEVRERCRKLLPEVLKRGLQARVDLLLKDTDNKAKQALPGWERFAKQVGNDSKAKEFYARMLLKNPESTLLFATDPKRLVVRYKERLAQMAEERDKIDDSPCPANETHRYSYNLHELAFWLFVFGEEPTRVELRKTEVANLDVYSLLRDRLFLRGLDDPETRPILEKLLIGWMRALDSSKLDSNSMESGFLLARDHDLKGIVQIAREQIKAKNPYPKVVPYALALTGQFGGREDLPLVESWLNRGGWSEVTYGDSFVYTVELQDVALAVTLSLRGFKPHDFGFPKERGGHTTFQVYNLGFFNVADRMKAFEMYGDWLRK